jgi:hypothetical protein
MKKKSRRLEDYTLFLKVWQQHNRYNRKRDQPPSAGPVLPVHFERNICQQEAFYRTGKSVICR